MAAVLGVLDRLLARADTGLPRVPTGVSARRLEQRAVRLLGPKPLGRRVRMMVTMPSEAAADDELIRTLLDNGMNVARINCAHDDAAGWTRMAGRVRKWARVHGRPCRVFMDLGGPKLRTGPLRSEPPVIKVKPPRDALGRTLRPARIALLLPGATAPQPGEVDAVLPLRPRGAHSLPPGGTLEFSDTRGKPRRILLDPAQPDGSRGWVEQTTYWVPGMVLHARPAGKRSLPHEWFVDDFPGRPGRLLLFPGDALLLTRSLEEGHGPRPSPEGGPGLVSAIGCTLPEAFRDVRLGEPVWLDDGKIGGVIEHKLPNEVRVRITHTPPGGAGLGADKGINLPLTRLRLDALTAKDREDLPAIAREADAVALSFVEKPSDIRRLRRELARQGGRCRGVVLKIETRRAFANLPALLLELLREPNGGVMIARGDLAVECGFERLAEVQEEILWLCEAAQVPVIWATQVLETLAKKGAASRAEITDAAMSNRAECVMLNKGPFIASAARSLEDILRRMEGHQSKKRPMLRPLSVAGAPAR